MVTTRRPVLQMEVETDPEEKKLLNKIVIFVFFVHKKYSRSFITLQLNHWCHMDYFNNVLLPFWAIKHWCICRARKLSDFIKNIFNCVPKMNEGLTGLERYEGE